jgi:hypothetical protein
MHLIHLGQFFHFLTVKVQNLDYKNKTKSKSQLKSLKVEEHIEIYSI